MEFNLAQVHEAVEAKVPDRDCVIFRDRRLTYRQFGDRSRQLANALLARGLGDVTERTDLAGHESGQDHLAIYLHNGNEYLEAMVGSYKARIAPLNVNYRYVAEELEYLLTDSGARAVVFHSAFAPVLDEVRSRLPRLEVLLQVADDSGNGLLDGAEWYEDALAAQPTDLPPGLAATWSPDDLYILYTGGTTGMPKGVLWRQADIFVAAMGGRKLDDSEFTSVDDITAAVSPDGAAKMMPGPPFMHGAAHWMAFNAFTQGSTLVVPGVPERLDSADVLRTVEAEGVNVVLIVGDAFARPLLEEVEAGSYDLSSVLALVSGGAALSAGVKARILEVLPSVIVMDGLGASETGQQGRQTVVSGQSTSTGDFDPVEGMCILSEDLTEVLAPGHDGMGWLAQRGRVPIGYLGDAEKSARTFPVIEGVRYSVPGDRAALNVDNHLELYGRDSVTINSGGEKIFAEEVEAALVAHPAVADCVVAGRPSERWGNEVVAVIALRPGVPASDEDLLEEAGRHIARYKLPKAIVRREQIQRSPSGKADYRWARAQAADE